MAVGGARSEARENGVLTFGDSGPPGNQFPALQLFFVELGGDFRIEMFDGWSDDGRRRSVNGLRGWRCVCRFAPGREGEKDRFRVAVGEELGFLFGVITVEFGGDCNLTGREFHGAWRL